MERTLLDCTLCDAKFIQKTPVRENAPYCQVNEMEMTLLDSTLCDAKFIQKIPVRENAPYCQVKKMEITLLDSTLCDAKFILKNSSLGNSISSSNWRKRIPTNE